jgi:pimeloyl-ACP methyl ester carboxylesterase
MRVVTILDDRSRMRFVAGAAVALACLLTFTVMHRAHSQSQDGPPAPLCPRRITITSDGEAWTVPVCCNLAIEGANPAVTRAVVGIHGLDRFATATYSALLAARRKVPEDGRATLVLAPQFLTETERTRYHVSPSVPCWKGSRWIQGDDSLPAGNSRRAISAYGVVDAILERLADRRLFPNLRTIVVAGHSGGGQFVQRYAAGTAVEERLAARGIAVRWVVANPSSYLYLTAERPVPRNEDRFDLPPPSVRRRIATFNNYKYGLDRLNRYMRAAGEERIRAQYPRHAITYLLGERDNDPNHPQLDRGYAAELEGATRLERGLAFYRYLRHLYGPAIARIQRLAIVPGVGHSALRMFSSDAGARALFADSPSAAVAGY